MFACGAISAINPYIITVADPEGIEGARLNPSSVLLFKYPLKMKLFGLTETKLFHFHGIFMKK